MQNNIYKLIKNLNKKNLLNKLIQQMIMKNQITNNNKKKIYKN